MSDYTIVLGVDGSPSSKAALRWAVWHAELTGGSITALMAWDVPAIYNWEPPEDAVATTARRLAEVIQETVGEPPVEIHREVAEGHPARALLDAAEEAGADLLVLGKRGRGGFTEALLGSVSQYCVHHARCPVVIVRG